MKRSRSINLARMRKSPIDVAKPLSVAVAAATLASCGGSTQRSEVYMDADHCKQDNPGLEQQCEAAYLEALEVAADSGPKYGSEYQCEKDFGNHNCHSYTSGSNNWFVPLMAGYMFAKVTDGMNYYRGAPLYTSYSPYSPYYNRWSTVDGWDYGYRRYGEIRTSKKAFDPKPKVTKTMSRGGFGSKVAAKSSWGGSKSSGGWGG